MYIRTLILLLVSQSCMAAEEKIIETSNYSFLNSMRSQTVAGNLVGNNTYNRIFTIDVSDSCDASSELSSSGSEVFYQVFEIHTPVGELADIEVFLTGLGDSTLSIYCAFNPLFPQQMLSAYDDDDGVGNGSIISPGDGLTLVANTSYYVVVQSFFSGDSGEFILILRGDIVFGPPPEDLIFINGFE